MDHVSETRNISFLRETHRDSLKISNHELGEAIDRKGTKKNICDSRHAGRYKNRQFPILHFYIRFLRRIIFLKYVGLTETRTIFATVYFLVRENNCFVKLTRKKEKKKKVMFYN